MRFSAVDIGSNAVRLLFAEVYKNREGEDVFRKISLVRLPIRLGEDAFLHGMIQQEKADKLQKTLEAYKLLNEVYGVVGHRVCATSAMREASNSIELIENVRNSCGIDIEILPGKREAEIIYENHVAESLNPKGCYLYVDVGGGSTELSIFKRGERIKSESFDIGTLRIKNHLVKENTWKKMKYWLVKNTTKYEPLLIIGTGGNINALYSLAKLKDYAPLFYKQLKDLNGQLKSFTVDEKIDKYRMRPDRADVIVPAADIFLKIMKWSNITEIMVPKLGLVDGIIHELYGQHITATK
ncbi:MAG TPA: exopolyphosphatase, partial [Flavobacteriales bacterium]|nr:exopolyphosphatase [Flavobacteriales bacterium]